MHTQAKLCTCTSEYQTVYQIHMYKLESIKANMYVIPRESCCVYCVCTMYGVNHVVCTSHYVSAHELDMSMFAIVAFNTVCCDDVSIKMN